MGKKNNILNNVERVSHCHSNKTALRMSLFYIYTVKGKFCFNKKLVYSSDMHRFVFSF